MSTIYWGILKNGEVRYFERPPKRPHVSDELVRCEHGSICMSPLCSGHTVHTLTHSVTKATKIIHCYHGHDRNVRRLRIVAKMLS